MIYVSILPVSLPSQYLTCQISGKESSRQRVRKRTVNRVYGEVSLECVKEKLVRDLPLEEQKNFNVLRPQKTNIDFVINMR